MRTSIVLLLVLFTGCWSPHPAVDDGLTPIRREGAVPRDAGAPPPDAGGPRDAGPTVEVDAGPLPTTPLVPFVEGLPPTDCGMLRSRLLARTPRDAGCGNGCLFQVTEDAGVLAYRSGSSATQDVIWFPVEGGLGEGYVIFTSERANGTERRLVAKSLATDAVFELQRLGPGNVSVVGQWFGGFFHYVVTEWPTPAGGPNPRSSLRAWSSATPVAAEVVAELPSPLSAGFGVNSLTAYVYVLALMDGLYEVPLYGVNRQARRLVEATGITALAVADTGPIAFATDGPGGRSIVAGSVGGGPVRLRVLSTQLTASRLGILDYDTVVALDPSRGVFLLDADGQRAPQLLYAQRDFVQGFRRVTDLLVPPFGGGVWMTELCDPDADAPTWGTVELELPSPTGAVPSRPGQARWVTGTADWPWRTPVLDTHAGERPIDRAGTWGAFLLQVVGP
jgi:hypothetical protein